MAEGAFDTEMENPLLDHEDEDDDEEEVERTHSFIPTDTSTPGSEGISLVTRHHEQSGLPDNSYEETSFGGGVRTASERSWATLTNLYHHASSTSLETFYDPKTSSLW